MTDRELLNKAKAAAEFSYSPYSHFPVGAALECADGSVYTGCNVENASYGGTICAERVAIVKAVSEGKRDFVRLAIFGEGEKYCLPCGMCRQFLNEFSRDMELLCSRAGGGYVSYSLKQLMPYPFEL